ncbi:MAG: hypothetical protein PHU07_00780 [Acidocella sp.]|nr:hypothetical protein [Acidocella sp.]
MSGAVLTINGAYNGQTGILGVPSNFEGETSTQGSLNAALQSYLDGISASITSGQMSFMNYDIVGGSVYSSAATVPGAKTFEEFTNVDSAGGVSTALASGSYTVNPGVTDIVVQAPGSETVAGNREIIDGTGSVTSALFSALSNVTYSVTNPGAGVIYAAGGADSITLYSAGLDNNETIYSAGTDTINLVGNGTDYVSIQGSANDVIQIEAANANVTATGAATVGIHWDNGNAGGTLNFINNSSQAATIYTAVFMNDSSTTTAVTHVTASGGAGGGFYVGGQGGNNSLVGGTGVVTLVGGGEGDYLSASSGGMNELFAGSGTETMVASSTTGSNLFQVGLNYPGLGQPAGNGVISTEGSGVQSYFLGNSNGETIYGSQNASFNLFNIVSNETAGGGIYNIYNFNNHGFIKLIDAADTGAGSASVAAIQADPVSSGTTDIYLSDGTTIKLHGVSANSLTSQPGSDGVLSIYQK